MTPRPERRLTSPQPFYENAIRWLAARELADDTKLAETVARRAR